VLPDVTEGQLSYYSLVVETPTGERKSQRMAPREYLEIVACTNMKQRSRTLMEYFHADRLNYAVVGTPNRLEYDQGFFVKYGDSAADVKPIAHLYKSQVYAIARGLGLPPDICGSTPTTDTYSLPQGQDEFYWRLSYPKMDMCLYGKNHGISAAEVAAAIEVPTHVVDNAYKDIDQKRRTTRYLQMAPMLSEEVGEIAHYLPAGEAGAALPAGSTVRHHRAL
jgi:NAD+ synthase